MSAVPATELRTQSVLNKSLLNEQMNEMFVLEALKALSLRLKAPLAFPASPPPFSMY